MWAGRSSEASLLKVPYPQRLPVAVWVHTPAGPPLIKQVSESKSLYSLQAQSVVPAVAVQVLLVILTASIGLNWYTVTGRVEVRR